MKVTLPVAVPLPFPFFCFAYRTDAWIYSGEPYEPFARVFDDCVYPAGYLFLDLKRKLGLAKRIQKQIAKFELNDDDLQLIKQ